MTSHVEQSDLFPSKSCTTKRTGGFLLRSGRRTILPVSLSLPEQQPEEGKECYDSYGQHP